MYGTTVLSALPQFALYFQKRPYRKRFWQSGALPSKGKGSVGAPGAELQLSLFVALLSRLCYLFPSTYDTYKSYRFEFAYGWLLCWQRKDPPCLPKDGLPFSLRSACGLVLSLSWVLLRRSEQQEPATVESGAAVHPKPCLFPRVNLANLLVVFM